MIYISMRNHPVAAGRVFMVTTSKGLLMRRHRTIWAWADSHSLAGRCDEYHVLQKKTPHAPPPTPPPPPWGKEKE